MPIAVSCACGKSFSVADQHAGRRGKCKHCGAQLQIPTPAPVSVTANGAPDSDDEVMAWVAAQDEPTDTPSPPPFAVTLDSDDEPDTPRALKAAISLTPVPAPSPSIPFPAEPWYYRFLETYARISVVIGVVQFVIVTALTLMAMVPASQDAEGPPIPPMVKLLAFAVPIGFSFLVFITACLMVAPILLAVDSARNLRFIRWQLGPRQTGPN